MARQGKARQGKVFNNNDTDIQARRGAARRGVAGHGGAWQGKVYLITTTQTYRRGLARPGEAWRGPAWQGEVFMWHDLQQNGVYEVTTSGSEGEAWLRGFEKGMEHGRDIGYRQGFHDGEMCELRRHIEYFHERTKAGNPDAGGTLRDSGRDSQEDDGNRGDQPPSV